MKKVIGLIVLAMMVVIPMRVNAALDFSGFKCDDKVTASDGSVTKTCYIIGKATNGSSISKFTGTLTLQNMSIKSITASDPWTDASNGTSLAFNASTNVSSSNFTIATIVFNVDNAAEKCAVQLVPCYDENGTYGCGNTVDVTESYTCKVVNGKYYGKNGTEVTADVYEAECVNNPQTGSFVPYVVIVAGIALAVGVFTISRKNTKLYKI